MLQSAIKSCKHLIAHCEAVNTPAICYSVRLRLLLAKSLCPDNLQHTLCCRPGFIYDPTEALEAFQRMLQVASRCSQGKAKAKFAPHEAALETAGALKVCMKAAQAAF